MGPSVLLLLALVVNPSSGQVCGSHPNATQLMGRKGRKTPQWQATEGGGVQRRRGERNPLDDDLWRVGLADVAHGGPHIRGLEGRKGSCGARHMGRA